MSALPLGGPLNLAPTPGPAGVDAATSAPAAVR